MASKGPRSKLDHESRAKRQKVRNYISCLLNSRKNKNKNKLMTQNMFDLQICQIQFTAKTLKFIDCECQMLGAFKSCDIWRYDP